jgi:hypothetical protein
MFFGIQLKVLVAAGKYFEILGVVTEQLGDLEFVKRTEEREIFDI